MPHQCTGCGRSFQDGSKEMLGGCPACGGNTFQFYPAGTEVPEEPPADPEPPDSEGSSVANAVGRASTTVRDMVSTGSNESRSSDRGDDPNLSDGEISSTDAGEAWPSETKGTAHTDGPGAPANTPMSSCGDSGRRDADAIESSAETNSEDTAQADARSGFVSDDELALHDDSGRDPDNLAVGGIAGRSSNQGSDTISSSESPRVDPPESAGDGRVVSEPTEEQPELSELREQLDDQFESIKIVEPGQYELNLMELYDREEYIIALQENGRYVIQVPEDWLGDRVED